MRSRFLPTFLTVAMLVIAGGAAGARLNVDDVVRLKQMGFSEAEIQAEVAKGGEALALKEADLKKLREEGFSESLIAFLQHPTPAPQAEASSGGSGEERLMPTEASPPPVKTETPPAKAQKPPEVLAPEEAPPPKRTDAAPQLVARVQEYLNLLGYPSGPADGVMGEKTGRAIEQYQRDQGLPIDGCATEQLVAHLRNALLQRQRGYKAPEPPEPAPVAGLVGYWAAEQIDSYGNTVELYLELLPNGAFQSLTQGPNQYAEAQGDYEVRGNQIFVRNQHGQTASYTFSLQGRRLILEMPDSGMTITYIRQE